MTKSHEEEWEVDADGDIRRLNKKGVRTSLVLVRAAGNNESRARLASKAPNMARALLEDVASHYQPCQCGKCVLLREAGVLE